MWDIVMHLDRHVAALGAEYGVWAYVLLFGVVFAETGLIVATILPSDTVLFAAGALAAKGVFPVWVLYAGFALAAFAGDYVNYLAGVFLGERFFVRGRVPCVSPKALMQAHDYYVRHGGMTVVAARFVPILRAVAPLTGGIVGMGTGRFLAYSAVGKAVWAAIYVFGGYFFGQIPWMEKNFAVVVLVAMGVPFVVAGLRVAWERWKRKGRREGGKGMTAFRQPGQDAPGPSRRSRTRLTLPSVRSRLLGSTSRTRKDTPSSEARRFLRRSTRF